ncbi:acyltransferase family protein [Kitasatospora sp. NPDC001574]
MHDGPSLGAPSAASGPTLQDMREARGIPAPRGSRYAVPAPPPEPPRPLPPSVRFASVDGLRGLAIASVLLYHTNWFQNGLFGVDAFFVLSGFLVTLVLIRELDRTDRIALGVFYRRRAKRLLPGLLATVFLVVALSALVSPLKDVKELRPQALAALAQVANWAQLERGDAYWQHYAGIDPLAAMWSLSITEQFYVVWPLLLLLIHAVCRRAHWQEQGLAFPDGMYEEIPLVHRAMLTAARIAVLPQDCVQLRRRETVHPTGSPGSSRFDLFDQYERSFALLDELLEEGPDAPAGSGGPGPDAVRDALFTRMIRHYLFVFDLAGCVARAERPQFFHRAAEHHRRFQPPGHRRPAGREGVKFSLLAGGAYPAFEVAKLSHIARGTLTGRR